MFVPEPENADCRYPYSLLCVDNLSEDNDMIFSFFSSLSLPDAELSAGVISPKSVTPVGLEI